MTLKQLISEALRSKTGNIYIQMFRYLISGGVAFAVDASILYVLTEWFGLYYLISSIISSLVGLIITYLFSIKWIFDYRSAKDKRVEFIVFALIGASGLGLTQLFMWLFTSCIGLHYMLSKVVTTVLVSVWNFCFKKILLFSKRKKASHE